MISKDTAISAVSEALHSRAVEFPNYKEFRWKIVEATGCDYRTAERWIDGKTEPTFHDVASLFIQFGTAFKNEVELGIGPYESSRREHSGAVKDGNKLAKADTTLNTVYALIGDYRKAS